MKENTVKLVVPINVNFTAGFLVGLTSGIGFHPVDRALYLRAVDSALTRQPLFSAKYWKNPMTGLRTTVYQRILSSGIYFSMQGELNTRFYPKLRNEWHLDEKQSKLVIGMMAGSTTGVFANASYAVKFFTINHKPKGKPLENAIEMWRKGGIQPFKNGIYAGVMRDALFGVVYEEVNLFFDEYALKNLQKIIPKENKKINDSIYFSSRFISAMFATTLSSPLNYARNMQFKTKPHKKQATVLDIWCKVWSESNKSIKQSKNQANVSIPGRFFHRMRFFQSTFMIGAGTVRAAAGMALGQVLFDKTIEYLKTLDNDSQIQETKIKPK